MKRERNKYKTIREQEEIKVVRTKKKIEREIERGGEEDKER